MRPESGQQKTPIPSSARTKGRHRQMLPLRSVAGATGGLHAAFRGTTSNTPDRYRSDALSSPTGAPNRRAESGHRYNGLARIDLLARMMRSHRGLSSVVVLVGDLRRNGSGGTRSHVIYITRSRSLGDACCAYSSQRASRRQPTVDDTIANGPCACQVDSYPCSTYRFT